ncbi:MAG: hypothetical protein JSS30_04295 [Verrucomicrobia bacterium]|nr:hypothetical protein [Verrucomicrobiota bacterium]
MTQPIANPVLHPAITIDYVQEAATNSRWELIWKVAATAAFVSTIALAILGTIYSSIFFAPYFAIAALFTSASIKSHILDRAIPYENIGAFQSKLVEKLSGLSDETLGSEIAKLGIKPGIEPGQLKSTLAHYLYFKEKQTTLAEKIKQHLDLSESIGWSEMDENNQVHDRQVSLRNYNTANLDWADGDQIELAKKVNAMHLARYKLISEAAFYNLEAAYALKLMASPYESRLFDDFVQISPFNSIERFITKAIGYPGADIFAKTKPENIRFTGETIRSFTAEQLHTMDTLKLAHEIFELEDLKPKGWW